MAKRRHKKIRVDENDDCTSSTKRNRSSKKDLKDMMEEISDSTNDSSDPKGTAIGCNKATKLGDQSHSKTIGNFSWF
ncbi:unnamed protein product [Anisakis simplex]|uniref:Ovule protein n=1 Tax=Anisakis simplex TaxID=6269 RepID=A0A0M3KJV1_ANISI|nr:unnamed protein product [Anisakis simplex]